MVEEQRNEDTPAVWLVELVKSNKAHGLSYVDVEPFLQSSFDPQEYANQIIDAPKREGGSSALTNGLNDVTPGWLPQSGRVEGDLSVALGRLNLAIDDVDRLVREEVTGNASELLSQTTSLLDLRPALSTLNLSLVSLEEHQAKLVARISTPRQALYAHTNRLASIRSAQTLIKRSQRLVRLLRRLHSQMQGLGDQKRGMDDKTRLDKLGEEDVEEQASGSAAAIVVAGVEDLLDADDSESTGRGLSRFALTVAEILTMLQQDGNNADLGVEKTRESNVESIRRPEDDERPVRSLMDLEFVQECMPMVEDAKERVTDLMESMIVRGLRDLSPTLLSTSLQTAFNLGQLTDLVRDLLADLTDVVRDRVHAAFDMQSLARELGSKEPQTQHSTTYRARRGDYSSALHQKWTSSIWARLETLIVGEMGAVCSKVYTLERVLNLKQDPSTRTSYLEQSMGALGDRPSTMFWSTLAASIDHEVQRSTSPFLLQALEQGYPRLLRIFQDFYAKVSVYTGTSYNHASQSPETLIILRSLARFEESFLAKSSSRFEALLDSSFTNRQVPGAKEAAALAKLALGELDAARQDPLLLHAVGKMVCDWLVKGLRRLEDLALQDSTTQSFQTLTPSHIHNASLTACSYHLSLGLERAAEQGPIEFKQHLLDLSAQAASMQDRVYTGPLLQAISRDISDIMSRMHYVDFGLDRDAVSGSGSAYMADLSDRMWFLREQLFVHYELPTGDWLVRIGKHALKAFVMHASLIRPLAEGGKLKLTSDMTELEFSISQLLASAQNVKSSLTMNDCGIEFTTLRQFRHLLFANLSNWQATEAETYRLGQMPLIASHHILARSSSLKLPHELHKWSRSEYVRWLDAHPIQDGLHLVQGCIQSWQADSGLRGKSIDSLPSQDESKRDEVLIACLQRLLALVSVNE